MLVLKSAQEDQPLSFQKDTNGSDTSQVELAVELRPLHHTREIPPVGGVLNDVAG